MSGKPPAPPTAHRFCAETAVIESSSPLAGSLAGLATTAQDVPFQCSMRLPLAPEPAWLPTAQASDGLRAATPCRRVSRPACRGADATIDQVRPLKCSML